MTDYRSRPRRRGAALEQAILDAALDELAEVGYEALTIDAVAARAGAGKASVYRRWGSKPALVMAAVYRATREAQTPADTGSLRTDTFAWLRTLADLMDGTLGQALLALVADTAARGRTADIGTLSQARGEAIARMLVGRARERGEPVRASLTARQLTAPLDILKIHGLTHGMPVDDATIRSLVDDVALPLWTTPESQPL